MASEKPSLLTLPLNQEQMAAIEPLVQWCKEQEERSGLGAVICQPIGGALKCYCLTHKEASEIKQYYAALLIKAREKQKEKGNGKT